MKSCFAKRRLIQAGSILFIGSSISCLYAGAPGGGAVAGGSVGGVPPAGTVQPPINPVQPPEANNGSERLGELCRRDGTQIAHHGSDSIRPYSAHRHVWRILHY